jgi:hypothetical protein
MVFLDSQAKISSIFSEIHLFYADPPTLVGTCDVESSPCASQCSHPFGFIGTTIFIPLGIEAAVGGSGITMDTIFGCFE